jgi:hypothetical protein
MDTLWLALGGALLVALAAWWWLVRRGRAHDVAGRPGQGALDALDTLEAWRPTPTRVLTGQERLAYATLVRALPDHLILAQVPLARFLKVPARHSYVEWLDRVGNLCADLVVCDHSSQVIAVVDVRMQPHQASDRNRQRHERMKRVLRAAGIPLQVWYENALPTPEVARELLLRETRSDAGEAAAPHTTPTSVVAAAQPFVTAGSAAAASANPLGGPVDGIVPDEVIEMREPPPSTWFDTLDLRIPRPVTSPPPASAPSGDADAGSAAKGQRG